MCVVCSGYAIHNVASHTCVVATQPSSQWRPSMVPICNREDCRHDVTMPRPMGKNIAWLPGMDGCRGQQVAGLCSAGQSGAARCAAESPLKPRSQRRLRQMQETFRMERAEREKRMKRTVMRRCRPAMMLVPLSAACWKSQATSM